MDIRNQTSSRGCHFLGGEYFTSLYETFLEAFSDYVIPFALTEKQFETHLLVNGVDLNRTVGFIDDTRLVGFSLNGFGMWENKSTVYDAGTGVVPAYRRRGLSRAMFEMMLAKFERDEIEQFLLEVVTTNTAAISLYEQLGFRPVRELSLLQCDKPIENNSAPARDIEIRDVIEPDWRLLETFWDAKPSWQNSIDAITRCFGLKRFLGAYEDERCVGYVIFSARFGRIAQFAVSKNHRNQGIGTALVRALKNETADGFSMQVINIDKSLTGTIGFFEKLGFYERLSQHEMIKPL